MNDLVKKIIESYSITDYEISEYGNNYIIKSKSGKYILNSFKKNAYNPRELFRFKEDIYNNGFRKFSRTFKTESGNDYIVAKNRVYYLTPLMEYERKMEPLMFYKSAVQVLRQFHMCTKELFPEKYNLDNEYKKTIDKYIKRVLFMINLKEELNTKIIKSRLDIKMYTILDLYSDIFEKCLIILRSIVPKTSYKQLQFRFSISRTEIDDFGEVNGKVLLKDIKNVKQSYYLVETGSLLNDIENTEGIKWSYEVFQELAEAYCKGHPFNTEELYLFYCFTIFPYKLYKICKKKYKNFMPDNSILLEDMDYFLSIKSNIDFWMKEFENKNNM